MKKKKVKGLISKMRNLIDTDNSVGITRRKEGWGKADEGKEG